MCHGQDTKNYYLEQWRNIPVTQITDHPYTAGIRGTSSCAPLHHTARPPCPVCDMPTALIRFRGVSAPAEPVIANTVEVLRQPVGRAIAQCVFTK